MLKSTSRQLTKLASIRYYCCTIAVSLQVARRLSCSVSPAQSYSLGTYTDVVLEITFILQVTLKHFGRVENKALNLGLSENCRKILFFSENFVPKMQNL